MQTPDEQGGGGLVAAAASASYGSVSNENESDVDVAGRSSSSSSGWRGAGGTEGPSVASLSLDRQASDASAKLSPRECAEEDDEENPGTCPLPERLEPIVSSSCLYSFRHWNTYSIAFDVLIY